MVGSNGRCFESDEFEIHIVILYEIFEPACTFLRSIKSSTVLSVTRTVIQEHYCCSLYQKTYNLLTRSYKFVRRKKVVLPDSEFQDALERTIPQLCRFFLL